MNPKHIAAIVAASFILLALGACDILDMGTTADAGPQDGCGSEVCDHELTVEVIRVDEDAFQVGAYTFGLVAPDYSEYSIDCYLLHPETGLECEYGDLDVISASTDEEGRVISLDIAGAPESVVAIVEMDGAVIGQRTLYPDYDIVTPNGEDCPPACYVGEEFMAVNPW